MENLETMTVAEVVTVNIKTADIFKKNGIDFCCGGHIPVREVCTKKGIDYKMIKEAIEQIEKLPQDQPDYNSYDLDVLADHIVKTHHAYVEEANDLLIQYSDKVAKVHGHHYTEVVEINRLFHALAMELKMHMHKEEMILFPYIRQLAITKREGGHMAPPAFGTIQNPINMMEMEHTDAGDVLKKIEELTNHFTPPEGACNTFRALYAKLEEYQDDLHQHIHLENNILFPKAIALEVDLTLH